MSRIVAFGEIMARLATPGFKRFQQTLPGTLEVTFAGAEASVAASIAYLGGDASFCHGFARQSARRCLCRRSALNGGVHKKHPTHG